MVHHLKTWPLSFDAIRRAVKSFDIRLNDRGFKVGDILLLEEYDPVAKKLTGKHCRRTVTYVLEGGEFGLPHGYVCMAIVPPPVTSLKLLP
jgi:hypothetical protein